MYINHIWMKLLNIDWTVDAVDLLVLDDGSGDYQSGFLGDIDIYKNLIQAKSDDQVDVHQGYRLQLFETIEILSGKWDGEGWQNPKTSGYGLCTKGLFKLVLSLSNDKALNWIADHIDIRYVNSKIDSGSDHPLSGTTYQGLSLIYMTD